MQYNVCRNQNSVSKKRFPFLLDVQAELLADLETRVVIPIANRDLYVNSQASRGGASPSLQRTCIRNIPRGKRYSDKVLTQLTPIVQFEGGDYVLVTPQMAGVTRRELGPRGLSHTKQMSAGRSIGLLPPRAAIANEWPQRPLWPD
jgi:toxin CcdB